MSLLMKQYKDKGCSCCQLLSTIPVTNTVFSVPLVKLCQWSCGYKYLICVFHWGGGVSAARQTHYSMKITQIVYSDSSQDECLTQ